ncbi:MAG: hypothetical protein NUV80_03155 [Candidatus Berkelbacteria bacterium]|nr:hypothetical protein [Candidatus Berkelbacteria bacterium]
MDDQRFFLEWSQKQRCFHVAEAKKRMQKNLQMAIANDHWPDYAPIGIFNSASEASSAADMLREKSPAVFGGEL